MEIGFLPRFALNRLSANSERRTHWNLLLSSLLVVFFFTLWPGASRPLLQVPHVCLFETLTGLPCPGCGMSRSLGAFFSGDAASAWALHPAGPVLASLLLMQIVFRGWLLASPSDHAALAGRVSRITNRLGLLALFGGWLLKFHH